MTNGPLTPHTTASQFSSAKTHRVPFPSICPKSSDINRTKHHHHLLRTHTHRAAFVLNRWNGCTAIHRAGQAFFAWSGLGPLYAKRDTAKSNAPARIFATNFLLVCLGYLFCSFLYLLSARANDTQARPAECDTRENHCGNSVHIAHAVRAFMDKYAIKIRKSRKPRESPCRVYSIVVRFCSLVFIAHV